MALTQLKTGAIADDAVTTDKLANAINTARDANTAKTTNATHTGDVTGATGLTIADNAVTLAKMAGGTDGQIITYDANGDPVAVGPGTDGQVLTSTGAGSPPAFEAIPASGTARNLIINGAMNVAQRGTSSSATGNAFLTLDRFRLTANGYDEMLTQEQADVASGTTPYNLGFRKCFKVTNGNQNSGAGAADYARIGYAIEAQDLATSGWNYTSASSYITFQFWIKSSVAQSFKVEFYSDDSPKQVYSMDTGSLSADTWTKVTKTIPGNSNLTFNNDVGEGIHIRWLPFFGTNYTDNSVTEDAWASYSSTTRTKDNTSTWWTTDDATFELTGVQLEVGNTASDFAHEDINTTLRKCQRYCWRFGMVDNAFIFGGIMGSTTNARMLAKFPVPMRANPTISINALKVDGEVSGSVETVNSVDGTNFNSDFGGRIVLACDASTVDAGASVMLYTQSSSGYIQGDSEL